MRRALVMALLAALAGAPAHAAAFPPDSAVRAILAARVATGRVPGLVVGLLDHGATRVIVAGVADSASTRPLDGRTVFEIGSVTKVFTATLLADMARRGEVRLDQPVAELLPKTVHVPSARACRGSRATWRPRGPIPTPSTRCRCSTISSRTTR
ncbi:MAG: beta-lactamase family protein [Candidatus Eisenbacteria bacterium]|uniref:Beta-lactamase family protein n=1 Tax=Eiseniibacteriota bacterium TaxID=2212470 RepID=A0A9D6L6Z0_UNCEI|nr:beta-lactamase family protein [Candidatus Eisenbacteria bacterium]